ncbi:MAG: hypothetical protein K6A34_04375 [Methanobrevibacter sp.]|nr:hypothetical protein [Methanobrevibacter sp.]
MNKKSIAALVSGIVSFVVSIWGYIQYQNGLKFLAQIKNSGGYFVFSQADVDIYLYVFIIFLILGIGLIVAAVLFARKD